MAQRRLVKKEYFRWDKLTQLERYAEEDRIEVIAYFTYFKWVAPNPHNADLVAKATAETKDGIFIATQTFYIAPKDFDDPNNWEK